MSAMVSNILDHADDKHKSQQLSYSRANFKLSAKQLVLFSINFLTLSYILFQNQESI